MAPSAKLSATIAAFSCADHLRRRSTPVITSTRRGRAVVDTSLVSSLRSTLWSKRCLLMGRHHARAYLSRNVGAGHRLPLVMAAIYLALGALFPAGYVLRKWREKDESLEIEASVNAWAILAFILAFQFGFLGTILYGADNKAQETAAKEIEA